VAGKCSYSLFPLLNRSWGGEGKKKLKRKGNQDERRGYSYGMRPDSWNCSGGKLGEEGGRGGRGPYLFLPFSQHRGKKKGRKKGSGRRGDENGSSYAPISFLLTRFLVSLRGGKEGLKKGGREK